MVPKVKVTFVGHASSAMTSLTQSLNVASSDSLLLLLEQAIAARSAAFVGTPSSSATWVLAQDRIGEGRLVGEDRRSTQYMFPEYLSNDTK
jgi:hypothetical protein